MRYLAFTIVVFVCAVWSTDAAADTVDVDASDGFSLRDDGQGWAVVQGDDVVRTLEIPPGWRLSGPWSESAETLGENTVVTEWTHQTRSGLTYSVLFVGKGNLDTDTLVHVRATSDLDDERVAILDIDGNGTRELVRVSTQPNVPDCGLVNRQLDAQVYTPTSKKFDGKVSLWSPPSGSIALAATDSALTEATLSGITGPAQQVGIARPLDARGAADPTTVGLTDDALETRVGLGAEDVLVVRPLKTFAPQSLVLVFGDSASDAMALVFSDGRQVSLTGATPGASLQIPWPEGAACIGVRVGDASLSEVAVVTALDLLTPEEARAALVDDALGADDRGRVLVAASLLAPDPGAYEAVLEEAARAATDTDRLRRILLLAESLPRRRQARLALTIGSHAAADEKVVETAADVLRRFPDAAAFALRKQIERTEPGTDAYRSSALLLASLPAHASLGPLLNELDKSVADATRTQALLDDIAGLPPALVIPEVSRFVGVAEVRDDTRLALLRILVRFGERTFAALPALADESAIVGLLGADSLQLRLLASRIVARWQLADGPTALQGLLASKVDVERMEALRGLVAIQGADALGSVTAALADESPTVRIAAARLLALEPLVGLAGTREALLEIAQTEHWPEARGAALWGLFALQDPTAGTLAITWLDDPESEIALRQAAARAMAGGRVAFDWVQTRTWLERSELLRSTRREIMDGYLNAHTGAELEPLAAAVVTWAGKADDEDLQRLAGAALLGLRKHRFAALPKLLVAVYDATVDTQVLRLRSVELMGEYDTPEIGARLEQAITSDEPSIAEAADRSLKRIQGVPAPLEQFDPYEMLP